MPIKKLLIESRKHLALLCIFLLNEDPFFPANTIFLQTWECDPGASFVYCPPSAFAKVFFTPHEKPSPGFLVLSFWPLATHHRAGIVLSWAGHGVVLMLCSCRGISVGQNMTTLLLLCESHHPKSQFPGNFLQYVCTLIVVTYFRQSRSILVS